MREWVIVGFDYTRPYSARAATWRHAPEERGALNSTDGSAAW